MRRALHTATRRRRTIALAVLVCGPLLLSGLGGESPGRGQVEAPSSSQRCHDAIRTGTTGLRLHLIDRAGLSPQAVRMLRAEAVQPWLDAGVNVQWAPLDVAAGGAEDVYVTLKRSEDDGGPAVTVVGRIRTLASILFVDGRPTTQVTGYVTEVERLAATSRVDDHPWHELPRFVRDRLIGRALGRAIAHEIGHYLFASAAHAAGGLMRAQHPIERLLTSSGAPFHVIPPP